MSCKGSVVLHFLRCFNNKAFRLVELIVLNVGLQAGVLDTRVFSMFVIHAIILTFITTPLTLMFYPSKYRIHTNNTARDAPKPGGDSEAAPRRSTTEEGLKTRFAVVLDKIEQLPAAMTLAQLLHPSTSTETLVQAEVASDDEKHSSPHSLGSVPKVSLASSRISIDALRLIELTTRTSAVLKSTESASLLQTDSIISIFRTFGQLNKLVISAALSVIPYDEFSTAISTHVSEAETEMVILPWSRGTGATSTVDEDTGKIGSARNPFDGIFNKSNTQPQDQTSSVVYAEFIRRVFLSCPSDVALFVDRGSYLNAVNQQLVLPFFGGPDDRLALTFLVQLCINPDVKATVVWVVKTDTPLTPSSSAGDDTKKLQVPDTVLSPTGRSQTVYHVSCIACLHGDPVNSYYVLDCRCC